MMDDSKTPSVASVRTRVQALRRPRSGPGTGVWKGLDANMDKTKLAALIIGAFAVGGVVVSLFGEAYLPFVAALSRQALGEGSAVNKARRF